MRGESDILGILGLQFLTIDIFNIKKLFLSSNLECYLNTYPQLRVNLAAFDNAMNFAISLKSKTTKHYLYVTHIFFPRKELFI